MKVSAVAQKETSMTKGFAQNTLKIGHICSKMVTSESMFRHQEKTIKRSY